MHVRASAVSSLKKCLFCSCTCTCTYVQVQVQEQNKHFFKELTALARTCIDTNLRFVSASQGASLYRYFARTYKSLCDLLQIVLQFVSKCIRTAWKQLFDLYLLAEFCMQRFVLNMYLFCFALLCFAAKLLLAL